MDDQPKPRSERFDAWATRYVVTWTKPLFAPAPIVTAVASVAGIATENLGLIFASGVVLAVACLPPVACAAIYATLSNREERRSSKRGGDG